MIKQFAQLTRARRAAYQAGDMAAFVRLNRQIRQLKNNCIKP